MRIGEEKLEQINKDLSDLLELVKNGRIESAEIMRRTDGIDQSLKLAFGRLQDSYAAQMLAGEKRLSRVQFELGENFINNVAREIRKGLRDMDQTLSSFEWRLASIELKIAKRAAKEKAGIGRPAEKRVSARVSPSLKVAKKKAAAPKLTKGKAKVTNKRKKRG